MHWEVLEHPHIEKGKDWYASVVVITASLGALTIIANNWMLFTIIVLATIAFLLLAARPPELLNVDIRKKGVLVDKSFYPYNTLTHFNIIISNSGEHRIILQAEHFFAPLIIIPIAPEVDPDEVHDLLEEYIPVGELREPFLHMFFEKLGF